MRIRIEILIQTISLSGAPGKVWKAISMIGRTGGSGFARIALVGRLKEVPGVFSQGKTLDELKENIIDAYRMMLDDQAGAARMDALTCAIEVAV